MAEKEIGSIITYFSHIEVAAIKLKGALKVGDEIHIKGHTTDFTQIVDSIQIDRKEVEKAKKGDEIGIKVVDKVRDSDSVYLVS